MKERKPPRRIWLVTYAGAPTSGVCLTKKEARKLADDCNATGTVFAGGYGIAGPYALAVPTQGQPKTTAISDASEGTER